MTVTVLGTRGCGSAIAEAFLLLAEIPFLHKEVDYSKPGSTRDELLEKNPLGQIPTLVWPDGTVLTETLAIAHYVSDINANAGLIPTDPKERLRFFRWSTFVVSSIYPTFTYGDEPKKWVDNEEAATLLRASTDEHCKKLWLMMEHEAGSPYFLGKHFSAIDIYIKVMAHWRPGKTWMATHTPKIFAIHQLVSTRPSLQKLWAENFTDSTS